MDFTHTCTHSQTHRLLRAHLAPLRISGEGPSLPLSTHTGHQGRTPTALPGPHMLRPVTGQDTTPWDPAARAMGLLWRPSGRRVPLGQGAGSALRKEEHSDPKRGVTGCHEDQESRHPLHLEKKNSILNNVSSTRPQIPPQIRETAESAGIWGEIWFPHPTMRYSSVLGSLQERAVSRASGTHQCSLLQIR